MLLSPVIQLPTTVTGGEPLATVLLEFAMDWDAVSVDDYHHVDGCYQSKTGETSSFVVIAPITPSSARYVRSRQISL